MKITPTVSMFWFANVSTLSSLRRKKYKFQTSYSPICFYFIFAFILFLILMSTFSLKQISKTGDFDSNLILRQYRLDLMSRSLELKSINPKFRQNQIRKEFGCSSSIIRRYRIFMKMQSPHNL